MADPKIETRSINAFLSVYLVTKSFGGHEEGGWWYDSYEWLKVSIPFRAVQDYRWVEDDESDEMDPPNMKQVPYGRPRPADFQAEVQLQSHELSLKTFFGEETNTRSSVLSHGDIEFIIERNPGEREEWPRPRYE